MSNGVEASARWNPLRGVYAWVMRQAEGRFAWWLMAAIAFAESSFLPLPPDLMLVPMTLANRKRAFWLAAWCTFWSVTGGMLGYAIGSLLYNSVGLWLINAYGMGGDVQAFSVCYKHNAHLILLQGLTPIPYKLITISAGFAHLGFLLFDALGAKGHFGETLNYEALGQQGFSMTLAVLSSVAFAACMLFMSTRKFEATDY